MTDEQKKERLRVVLSDVLPPVHCNGCDEWLCEQRPGQDVENRENVLRAVWEEMKNWEQTR